MKREQHVELGAAALAGYLSASGGSYEGDAETMVADLLADLRHWCDNAEVSFESALDRAESLFEGDPEEADFGEEDRPIETVEPSGDVL